MYRLRQNRSIVCRAKIGRAYCLAGNEKVVNKLEGRLTIKERRSWFAEVENRVFFVLEWGRGIRKPVFPDRFVRQVALALRSRAENGIRKPDLLINEENAVPAIFGDSVSGFACVLSRKSKNQPNWLVF